MEFVTNSEDFHRHAHGPSKSETWRASHDDLQPSRVRQKINNRSSARGVRSRRVGQRCVCPVLPIQQPDQEPKLLRLPAQLADPLFFRMQNFVQILHDCPFRVASATIAEPGQWDHWPFHTRNRGISSQRKYLGGAQIIRLIVAAEL